MKTIEAAGLFDFITQVSAVYEAGGEAVEGSVGGIGTQSATYYFDATDDEGNLESFTEVGRNAMFARVVELISNGWNINLHTLGASLGARNKIFWFNAEFPEDEEEEIEQEEDAPEEVEEEVVEIKASKAAKEFADLHGIDLSKVQGTGSKGSVTKGDVVSYFDNIRA